MSDGGLDKGVMIRAAAASLYMQPVALELAAVDSKNFVQAVRQTYKAFGYTFSDTDIRLIHEELKHLVGNRMAQMAQES